jgi:hypothetical protein
MVSIPPLSSAIFADVAQQTHDALGNIFSPDGSWVGVVPGSQADVGSKGIPAIPSSAPAPAIPTTNPIAPNSFDQGIQDLYDKASQPLNLKLPNAGQWLQKALFGIDIEDTLFIIIGLLLLIAALFDFKPGQQIVVGARKAVKAGASAAAAALAP